MTAAARNTVVNFETWKHKQFTAKGGQHIYQGDAVCIKTADGKVYPGPSATGYKFLGIADEEFNEAADGLVNVDLMKERTVLWRANDGTITAANIGSTCYFSDPNTVSLNSTNQPKGGTILAVDTTLGVAFLMSEELP